MEKIGCELDNAIKSVKHEEYGISDGMSMKVKTVITLENGYTTSEITKVVIHKFANYDSAKEYCIQTNILSLIKRLNEVKSYFDFLNNNELTLINNKEFDEYVKFKTEKNKLESYSLLNENFEVIGKSKNFEFENPDAKYIVIPFYDFVSIWEDHEALEKLYDAGVDNWAGYDEALKDEG